LVVIAIMAILAALIFPITAAVNKTKIRSKARSEMNQIATGIESYKSKFGHYPPDHPGLPMMNQLYYELLGTTNDANGKYVTLDGRTVASPLSGGPSGDTHNNFGADGFVNVRKGGGGDEAQGGAGSVLAGLQASQSMMVFGPPPGGTPVMVLGSSADGFPSLPEGIPGSPRKFTPWCYNSSSPTNNPRSYDLWIDLIIGGKTNRICNWSDKPIINP
jgi:type II secretory pathway pseudopilin PulG